jgi:2-(3-amino-3-carboxypropyl)histidine synthase
MRMDGNMLQRGLEKISSMISGEKLALFTTVQHLDLLETVKEWLTDFGFRVFLGEPGIREEYQGQVLGCSFSAAKDLPVDVDGIVFLGTGKFHSLGLAMASQKEVHTLDPLTGDVGRIEKEDLDRMLRSRFGHINMFKDLLSKGEIVGILIGFKPGQRRLALAVDLSRLFKDRNIRSRIIVMDHVEPMKLRSLGIKIAVNTACPRIALDDSVRYSGEDLTLLTPVEVRIALDILSWSDYRFDEEWQ